MLGGQDQAGNRIGQKYANVPRRPCEGPHQVHMSPTLERRARSLHKHGTPYRSQALPSREVTSVADMHTLVRSDFSLVH